MCGSVLPQWCHKLLESYVTPEKKKKYDDNIYIWVHFIFFVFLSRADITVLDISYIVL